MTVKGLIEALQACRPESEVFILRQVRGTDERDPTGVEDVAPGYYSLACMSWTNVEDVIEAPCGAVLAIGLWPV